jgi:carbamoyl-phosphate synthase small subunit
LNNQKKPSWLILETGESYLGEAFTADLASADRAGEVVFNTSHSGYEEIATDPSYFSQIVVFTAPMQGNYGADTRVWESKRIWAEGIVCLEIYQPSDVSEQKKSWHNQLSKNQIPVLTNIDTRHVVKRLRSGGTPWGAIIQNEISLDAALEKAKALIEQKRKMEKDWVWQCSRREIEIHKGENTNGPRIGVLDFGSKENILREIKTRSSEVHIFPSRTGAEKILAANLNGLVLTNGPGDPVDVEKSTESVQALLGKLPIFGICMGHQILALALGAKTFKLKFGHRGSNHPIKDLLLNQIYMSSQNHGYAVDEKSLPSHVQVTHYNLNDNTVAGLMGKKLNCLSVQFHPESHPGPHESAGLFDYFINQMVMTKNNELESQL